VANVVQILVQGQDQFSGTAQKVSTEARGLGGAMGGLKTTMIGVAAGFIAAQVGMMSVQKVLSSTVGAATAYEHQLAVIRALTGATKGDTDTLKVAIKEMQKTLPKSAAELGAGAYFILSSGINDVATATKVLELSAKASTIGLGETGVVASVLTSIMNAYQLQAKDAAKATDTLVNIVKLGKGEPTEFAGALGRVIPIAAQMGIEFEQVGAVLATLTNTGLSAEESVVALRGIMVQILKPTDEAREAFAAMGFDVVAFRKELDENFVGAMARLSRSVGDNEEAWSTLFPEVRGMVGVMAAFGNQLPQTEQNLKGITDGAGALEQGFKEVSETTQFKLQKAMNDLNVQLQELGTTALPAVGALVSIINDLAVAADAAVHPVRSLGVAIESIPERAHKPFLGLFRDVEMTAESLVNMGRDAHLSRQEIMEWGAEVGLSAEEVREAMGETGVASSNSLLNMTRASEEAGFAWKQMAGIGRREVVPGLEDIGVAAGQTSQLFKDFTGDVRGGLRSVMPEVNESFNEWTTRLTDLGQDYSTMEGNLQTIMDALVGQHVRGVDDIMAVVRGQGPEFAADFAQWFRDDPIAAAQTLQQVMPGIMRQAATEAITNVVAATSRFNEEWQKNVIGALNKLPEEKRINIIADVDPELWQAAAMVELMKTGQIPVDVLALARATPHAAGGTVRSALQIVGEEGPELAALPMGTRIFDAGQTQQMLSDAGGGSASGGNTYVFNFSGPVLGDQSQANQLVQWILPSLRGALR